MPEIAALTLTDAEKAAILQFWDTQEAFLLWQRDTLAAEIERRAGILGQDAARAAVEATVEEARDTFPSLFPDAAPEQ